MSAVDRDALYFSPRLLQALSGLLAYPLSHVEAPMGYGKTSAVRAFLSGAQVKAVWLSSVSLKEDLFWLNLWRTLRDALPGSSGVVETLSLLGYPYDQMRIATAVELFQRLRLSSPTVLVMDDCHQLRVPGFFSLCEALAQANIVNLHIVLISRDALPGKPELLTVKNLLHSVGRESLALSPGEIREYYAHSGIRLDDAALTWLRDHTGGWIAALRLYMHSYAQNQEPVKPVAVTKLLENEIFAPLAPEVQALLLRLSPLERFGPGLAAAAGGVEDPMPMLEPLLQRNAFIAQDAGGNTYSLHSMFREFLQGRFRNLPEREQKQVFLRIGAWLQKNNEVLPSVEAYYAAGDYEKAVAALEADLSQTTITKHATFFLQFFEKCPPEILRNNPYAGLKYAMAALCTGDNTTCFEQCAEIERYCAQLPPDDPRARGWLGEIEVLRSLASFNDLDAMNRQHKKAYELLQRPSRMLVKNALWTLGATSVLYLYHREPACLKKEIAKLKACLPDYHRIVEGHGAGAGYQMEAESLYHAGDFQQAAIVCHRAQAIAAQHGQLSNLLCSMHLLIKLALADGNVAEALRLSASMRTLIQERKEYTLLHTADLCDAFMNALIGQPYKSADWIAEGDYSSRLYAFPKGLYYLAKGCTILYQGKYSQLLGLFSHLLEAGLYKNHLLFSLYGHIYMAAARRALHDGTAARHHLRTALELALPDKLYMPFVENSAGVLPMIKNLAKTPGWRSKLAPILRLAKQWDMQLTSLPPDAKTQSGPSLTKRQIQLARLAMTSKPYKDIAGELGIASSTVKRAYVEIFKKLGVKSRLELREYLAEYGPFDSDAQD